MAGKIVARFEKVSYDEFRRAHVGLGIRSETVEERIKQIYDSIKLPTRSTKRSSGYDFFYPGTTPLRLQEGTSALIPTGIRCVFLEDGYDLSIYPRSSMGFKYRVHLDNSVAIIDNDYFEANNEGHIMIKLSCDPRNHEEVTINPGDKFVQGIIREFFLAEEDDSEAKPDRNGGIGSTGL